MRSNDLTRAAKDADRLRRLAQDMPAGATRCALELAALKQEAGLDPLGPCPPNGLPRAAWFRAAADLVEASKPKEAAYCRRIAATIEARVLRGKPLHRIMTEGE